MEVATKNKYATIEQKHIFIKLSPTFELQTMLKTSEHLNMNTVGNGEQTEISIVKKVPKQQFET